MRGQRKRFCYLEIKKLLWKGMGQTFLGLGTARIQSIPRDYLFVGVPLGTRGEHSKSSWQAERRKHQVGRFLQILEQLPAKFVHTLGHQKRRWQFVCVIIVGHNFCHLGTIFVWNFAGCVIIKVFMLFWSLLIAFNLNEEVFRSTYLAAIERVMTEI